MSDRFQPAPIVNVRRHGRSVLTQAFKAALEADCRRGALPWLFLLGQGGDSLLFTSESGFEEVEQNRTADHIFSQ